MDPTIAALLRTPALTPQEVQRVLRSSRSLTYSSIRNGTIPSFRLGKTIKVPTAWLKATLGLTESAA